LLANALATPQELQHDAFGLHSQQVISRLGFFRNTPS
jgi:hypothetical protein